MYHHYLREEIKEDKSLDHSEDVRLKLFEDLDHVAEWQNVGTLGLHYLHLRKEQQLHSLLEDYTVADHEFND